MKATIKTSGFSEATKKLVIVKGRGSKFEKREMTNIDLYYIASIDKWCSIPER